MPIIGKCLEGITKAGTNVNERNVSWSQKNAKWILMCSVALCSLFILSVLLFENNSWLLLSIIESNAGLHGCNRAEQVRL